MEIYPRYSQHIEFERQKTTIFNLDSVTVGLNSRDATVLAYCDSYFTPYTKPEQRVGNEMWVVEESIDNKLINSSWVVNHHMKKISIVRNSTDNKIAMRLIRALMMFKDTQDKKVLFKAASFVTTNGKGIVLVGDEQAGKTSMVLDYMLNSELGGQFISNSHVSLKLNNGALFAYGYPMAMGVRLQALSAMWDRGSTHVGRMLYDLEQKKHGGDDRFYLEPQDLESYFNHKIIGQSRVDAILIVKNAPVDRGSTIQAVSAREVLAYFEEYFLKYSSIDTSSCNQILGIPIIDQRHLIKDIIERSEIYIFSYNIGNPEETMRLLQNI